MNRLIHTRRSVLLAAAGLGLHSQVVRATRADEERERTDRGRRLVLIDLFGGLDGVNAVVLHADDLYYRARPRLAVPADDVLRIDEYRGFHPVMHPLLRHWNEGRMAIVEGVGNPNQDLSHFRSSATWHRALPAGSLDGIGWIARLREHLWPDDERAELVTSIGQSASGAVYSPTLPALRFEDADSLEWIGAEEVRAAVHFRGDRQENGVLARLRALHSTSLRLALNLVAILNAYRPRVEYPDTEIGRKLRMVAALVRSDLGTRVFSLEHASFDSHSAGLVRQEDVLAELCDAIDAFLRDLQGTPAADECLVLCCSEMGRRLAENASRGTDHGAATPVLLFGEGVRGGLHGEHPSLAELDATGSLAHRVDFRAVYAAVIDQWFGGRHQVVLRETVKAPRLIG